MVLGQTLPACPTTTPDTNTPIEREPLATTAQAQSAAAVGELVALTAVANGTDVTYSWVQIGGPGVKLENADTPVALFRAPSLPADATLQFLVTTFTDTAAGRATVSVTVAGDPNYDAGVGSGGGGGGEENRPVARAGDDQEVDQNSTVTLNGGQSTGTLPSFRWRQVRGTSVSLTSPTNATTNFTAPAFSSSGSNVLEFELEVRDVRNRVARDRVKVTVKNPADPGDDQGNPRVVVETSLGNFTIEVNQEKAPNTARNFLQYVDDEFYDGLIFHRVIAGFVIQTGGFQPGLVRKEPRDAIALESTGLKNDRGTVAMARTNDPNSATSQFYVNLVDNNSLNPTGPGTGYAVFGKVIEGMDVVDRIATVQTETRQGFNDVPVTDVIVRSIRRQ